MECGHINNKKPDRQSSIGLLWSHQGLNLGPPDYESGATNQLSYRTFFVSFGLLLRQTSHRQSVITER